jgi:FKBP-type peptidyl-prolyl cis-trans isomerase 2
LREAIALYIACFGREAINSLAILYTHSHGIKKSDELRTHSEEVAQYVAETAGVANFKHIPFFCMENDPESQYFKKYGASEELIESNNQNINRLLRLASASTGFSTEKAEVRSYSYVEEMEKIRRQLEEEVKKNEVVDTFDKELPDEVTFGGKMEPIKSIEKEEFERGHKFLGIRTPFKKKVTRDKEVITGHNVLMTVTKRVQQCKKLASGQIICGEVRVIGSYPKWEKM